MTSIEHERERRVFYQDIVYAVCNVLDRHLGSNRPATVATKESVLEALNQALGKAELLGAQNQERWPI